MPAGDAQRVWFPEMLEQLRSTWSRTLTWPEVVELCSLVTALRSEIRQACGILPPLTRCPHCGAVSRSDIKGVSIRSALYALKNDGAITDDEFKQLDRSWKKYRTAHRLDAYGQAAKARQASGESGHRCG